MRFALHGPVASDLQGHATLSGVVSNPSMDISLMVPSNRT